MTEFADLGKHCHLKGCNRQDYLPFKCKHCKEWFCKDHWEVEHHNCILKPAKEIIVTKVKKLYTNTCSHKRCKTRELVPVVCTNCNKNYCLKHRLPSIHKCAS